MSSQEIKETVHNGEKELTIKDIRNAIPPYLFVKNESRFMVSVLFSVSATLFLAYLAKAYIPYTFTFLPIWLVYAFICGTCATGVWVLGHECGHYAFSDKWYLNDSLGYILHTILLVPYFSWQWSHHVHHMKCNHLTLGETHVPMPVNSNKATFYMKMRDIIGVESFSIWQIFNILTIGWPMYLLFGFTGGPSRGFTSHFFVPNKLFPKDKLLKVHISNLGLIIMFYLLYLWAQKVSFAEVLCVYIGPYLVVNAYLTGITFLQHTEDQVPHYDETAWHWLKGALATIDRNYHPAISALTHDIGTTHVVHHLFHELPHYNAQLANVYVKQILGKLYYQDKKSVSKALYDAGKLVAVKHEGNGIWKYF